MKNANRSNSGTSTVICAVEKGLLFLLVIAVTIPSSAGEASAATRTPPQDAEPNGCLLDASPGQGLPGRLLDGTGIPFIDNAFVVEMNGLISRFGVRPAAYVLDEPGVENGFATRDRYNPRWVDGTVVITLALIQAELGITGQKNNFTMPAIMAHEFGHIYQFKRNTHLPTKLLELQADYLAGWYMGNREGSSQYGIGAFKQDSQSFFEKGDYDFNSPTHHGTPEERGAAILQGYKSSSLSLESVYAESTLWVNAMGQTTSRSNTQAETSSIRGEGSREVGRAGQSRESDGSSFCTNLNSIIHAADNRFHSIRGATDPDGDGHFWSSKISLPGAQECEVEEIEGSSVVCKYQESTSESDLEDKFNDLAKNLEYCLPKWSKTEHTRFKGTDFTESPITVRVAIQRKSSTRHPGYTLRVWVDKDTGD
jgi:hypothetical protein